MEKTMSLTITSIIRTGADRGAQVVVVNGNMVAKFYDAMFYNKDEYPDVVWWADRSYSREDAAYEHLHASVDISDVVPAFYGTWSVNIDTTITKNGHTMTFARSVRMILIEYLDGQCMELVNAYSLSERSRTTILKQCIDAEMRILHAGVDHGDFCPRNIILLGSDYRTPNIRVKLIDFDISDVYNHPNRVRQDLVQERKKYLDKWALKFTSPIKRHFGHLMSFSCNGWCPNGLDGAEQWLWKNYVHDERYIPVRWDMTKGPTYPMHVDAQGHIDDPDYEDEDMIWLSESEIEAKVSNSSSSSEGTP